MKIHPVDFLAYALEPFSFRGKARIVEAICPHKGERITKVFGCRIKLDLNDIIQRKVYLHAFELSDSALVRSYLQPGNVFVDVGANIGYYTLLAASSVTAAGRVISFEPSPYASARLAGTIADNSLSQVSLLPVALGEDETSLPLYLPTVAGNHSPTMSANEGGLPVTVTVRRLDDCLLEQGIEAIDLMKIDVEGFEPNVLKGAGVFLTQRRIKAILCEFNEFWLQKSGSSSHELKDLLMSNGYRPADKQSGDNLFFVSGR